MREIPPEAASARRTAIDQVTATATPAAGESATELAKLGYVEGRNVAFVRRLADGNYDLLPRLAQELVGVRRSQPIFRLAEVK